MVWWVADGLWTRGHGACRGGVVAGHEGSVAGLQALVAGEDLLVEGCDLFSHQAGHGAGEAECLLQEARDGTRIRSDW